MNTRIEYLYRDASNYKRYNGCIIRGILSESQKQTILSCLDSGEFFIPSQVGLPESRFEPIDSDSDHCWYELTGKDFETTKEDATEDMTVDELVNNFICCKDNWDEWNVGDGYVNWQ